MILHSTDDITIYHFQPRRYSPWIDEADVRRRGALLVWLPEYNEVDHPWSPDTLFAEFPQAQIQEPFVLTQPTLRKTLTWTVDWAILPPAQP